MCINAKKTRSRRSCTLIEYIVKHMGDISSLVLKWTFDYSHLVKGGATNLKVGGGGIALSLRLAVALS